MKYEIIYYNERVEAWTKNMPKKMRSYYYEIVEKMKELGPGLGMPFTRKITGTKDLYEVRIKAKEGISRVFYCTFKNRRIMMLHGFIKKTQKTPPREINTALQRMNEVIK